MTNLEMDEVCMTRHGAQRTKDRLGISKKIADKNAEKALRYGVTHSEVSGKLCCYLDGIYLLNRRPNNMRVYNRMVYLFRGSTLITVLPLPHRYYADADKLQKRKSEIGDGNADVG